MSGQLQIPTPVTSSIDPIAGQAAKEAGTKRIGHLDPEWAAQCDDAIEVMARRGVPFQAADLIRENLVGEPPHPNCWGPRFIKASKRGVVEHANYGGSSRATVHQSICHQWIGTEAYRRAA